MATFGTFTAGQVLTAAELNAAGAYTSYTPTYGGFTLGNGTVNCSYTKFNKLVHFRGVITLGSTSVMTGPLDVSLPSSVSTSKYPTLSEMGGQAMISDANGSIYPMRLISLFGSTMRITRQIQSGATEIVLGDISGTSPFTWTTSDFFSFSVVYEAA